MFARRMQSRKHMCHLRITAGVDQAVSRSVDVAITCHVTAGI